MKSFVLYVSVECEYCMEALKMLGEKKLEYVLYDVTGQDKQINEAKLKYGWKTLPIVLGVDSDGVRHFIGGYTDLKEYLESDGDYN